MSSTVNSRNAISVKRARVHNLKNISVDLPRDQFVVITGLSGSGKSSLAFDTIYAEGQRRYVESLSAYARQFLGLMDKPDVDQIDGLSPAISIDQKTASHNPRSTVGTITEVYDHLRLLFARIGIPHCPSCDRSIKKQSIPQIMEKVLSMPVDHRVMIVAPMIKDKKGEHKHVLTEARKLGYVRVRVDGLLYPIEEALDLTIDKLKKHTIDVVVDRLVLHAELRKNPTRLHESLETGLKLGNGLVIVHDSSAEVDHLFSENFACVHCDINLPEIEPRNFSFNSPHGACQDCSGLGTKLEVDANLVIPNPKLSLAEGAIRPWSRTSSNQTWMMRTLEAVANRYGFSMNTPVNKLTKKHLDIVLIGTGDETFDVNAGQGHTGKVKEFYTAYEGVIPNLERRYTETESDYIRSEIERYMRTFKCPGCKGKRLRPEVLGVRVADHSIDQIVSLTIENCRQFFLELSDSKNKNGLNETQMMIANQVLKEINARLLFLENVGLTYLTLDRAASTLSGGEAQRIRLATQIGSSLMGVVYILDEPSIGLHQRDNKKLISTLKQLRDLGNTVLVVEHDEETIRSSDYVVDIGPGAGDHGGEVVAEGTPDQIEKNSNSITGAYLSGNKVIPTRKTYREGNKKFLEIKGAKAFNLKNVDAKIPLGKLVSITGVSGSGKSTLMTEILAKALSQHFYQAKDLPAEHTQIKGIENIDKVINIDQSPIGRTPRSNPATYTGVFTYIRDLFTQVPEAKMRGYKAGRFSFNVKGGRCEECQGDGVARIEMQFLPDVYVECQECHGKRYNQQALEIEYKERNISDILNMTVEEAQVFFQHIPPIHEKLKTLCEVGLSYIHLGQNATTLSGGEAQRVKLATELSRRSTGKTLYILDEPTTGLHFADVERLLHVLHKLADKGNSVLIIEHNLDVIKSSDWIIDLGPEGGDKGGEIVAEGTPKEVAKIKGSFTGQFLDEMIKQKSIQRKKSGATKKRVVRKKTVVA